MRRTLIKPRKGDERCKGRERHDKMARRDYHLEDFNLELPPPNKLLQVLAKDHSGTYILPFPCTWRDGAWHNPKSTKPLEATIIGWRKPPRVR